MFEGFMTLTQCQEIGKQSDGSVSFKIQMPSGDLSCRWLDAWFGLFTVDGEEGFLVASDFVFDNLKIKEVRCAQ